MKLPAFIHKLEVSTKRTLAIILAMSLGAVFPQAHALGAYAIPALIFFMLLMSFSDTSFSKGSVKKSHLLILIAMSALSIGAYYLLKSFHAELAISAFLIGITPTATAAMVITNMLGRRGDYVATSMILSNIYAALAIPFLSQTVVHASVSIDFGKLLLYCGMMVGIPFVLSRAIRMLPSGQTGIIQRTKRLTFPAWVLVLFLVLSQCSHFLRQADVPLKAIIMVFAVASAFCVINFVLGFFLGEKEFRRECSQSLGQKNTMLTLWVALTFFSPFIALGPTFYVICHNLWNSYQLARHGSRKD